MGTGARANSWQYRATSPGATHTLAEWEMAFITSRQEGNNCFLLQFPSTGPSCSASTENPEPTAGKQQAGWAGFCGCYTEMEQTLALRSHFPSVPPRDQLRELSLLWGSCKAATSQGDQQGSAQHRHERHRGKRHISAGRLCFRSKNAKMRCGTKNWTAKRNQFPGGSGTRPAGPPQHPAPRDGLAASLLLSAASKGRKSEVWSGCFAK